MISSSLKVLAVLLIYLVPLLASGQSDKVLLLNEFIGSWNYEATEIRSDGSTNKEFGLMEAAWFLDSTYMSIKCTLSAGSQTRSYVQFIGLDPHSKKFHSTYLYSGTMAKVFETGDFDEGKLELSLAGINPFSNAMEDGINIRSTFSFDKEKILLEVIELRSSGKWELGYTGKFTRKNDN